jgi:hypothetical protein
MSSLHSSQNVRTQWRLLFPVPEMLRAINADDLPEHTSCQGTTGRNIAISGCSEPRDADGIRIPSLGETQLSAAERRFALKKGLV